jgi:hypothetical protein
MLLTRILPAGTMHNNICGVLKEVLQQCASVNLDSIYLQSHDEEDFSKFSGKS